MDNPAASPLARLDWALVQAFLAVAETGSLSGAAKRLGSSQPTLGRQISLLEASLGLTLFTRHPRGLSLSEEGARLRPAAERMQAAMRDIALTAAGRDTRLQGTVRITASEVVSHHILPPIIAQIRQQEPGIQVVLLPSDSTENLLYREADIALRMYRSTQLDVITRHIGDLRIGVYAAKSYLERRGHPRSAEDLLTHDLIGYERSDLIVRGMQAAGFTIAREAFQTRCDDQNTYWQLLRAGCGIGFSQSGVAEADPQVEQIDLGFAIPPLPLWLAAHQAMRATPRIARVWKLLAAGLAPHVTAPRSA
ncbi:LysR family transcriptional regulator [Litorivita sp. NS0012-18]|uniref:LysR family transcriptional regulator n=1 Tax=Litorivita sp. NS0012-18 TaxID=3127655 RepID=UPI00310BD853